MPEPERPPDWAERLARVESRNVTFMEPPPPFWTEARGAHVRDATGESRLDFGGAFGVALAGHRHPRVVERIRAQTERLLHGMGDIHPPVIKVEFLERLADFLPWPDARTILGLSGSDAVDAALKTAHLATGRPGVIAFAGAYHGLALGALAVTHRSHFRTPFTDRLTDHVRWVPFPATPAEADVALAQVAELLARPEPVIGAVIAEPVQGRGGVRIPPSGFLARLHDCARAGGALLIADEIFTGMGRTGALFACEHEGVIPDLLCTGKALGGGLPLAACSGPAALLDSWPSSTGEAIHTSTFLGHPLGCAAGLGFLDALEFDRLAERARILGARALKRLQSELGGCDAVVEVRGRGLMLGVELGENLVRAPGVAVAERALAAGLIVLPAGERGEVVELTPPAILTDAELEDGLAILVRAIRSGDWAKGVQ